ncbi:MAG: hypothetical protein O2955_03780 [Planctomycetota bacterium]|nr:hypothetical protein [Planctomycetota bacterium]MDA1211608.1 hypothetical protein [Planctomycetota bacterium]
MSTSLKEIVETPPSRSRNISDEHSPRRRSAVGIALALAFGGICAMGYFTPKTLFSLAGISFVLLAMRRLYRWKVRRRWKTLVVFSLIPLAVAAAGARTYVRYHTAEAMTIPVQEFSNVEYPEDPSGRSVHLGKYQGRRLTLTHKTGTLFDFDFVPLDPHVARVVFHDVDVSLMTPNVPEWTKSDPGLTRIALTDRQWNRHQVRFDPAASNIEISGGDGFEKENLYSVELAKNCLNAGLWEVLLFVKEGDGKAMYYQGWFTFPLGHYKTVFEQNTGLSYREHWYYLEHWFDPAGTKMPLENFAMSFRNETPPSRSIAKKKSWPTANRRANDERQWQKMLSVGTISTPLTTFNSHRLFLPDDTVCNTPGITDTARSTSSTKRFYAKSKLLPPRKLCMNSN